MSAARSIGYEGFGREEAIEKDPSFAENFPILD